MFRPSKISKRVLNCFKDLLVRIYWRPILRYYRGLVNLVSPQLGFYYLQDDSYNFELAQKYLKRASELGSTLAQYQLALTLYEEYVEDPEKAHLWLGEFETNAKRGHPLSCFWMGYFKHQGIGCEADQSEAYSWLQKASELGENRATFYLSQMYAELGPAMGEITGETLNEETALQRSHALLELAASEPNPHPPALETLANMHLNGIEGMEGDSFACLLLLTTSEC